MAAKITQLLLQWSSGDAGALDRLMPLVYDELRKLAWHHLRGGKQNLTLQPTAIVNEACMQGRAQFFGLAARIIRELLIDDWRRRQREKRGGSALRMSMTGIEAAVQVPDSICSRWMKPCIA